MKFVEVTYKKFSFVLNQPFKISNRQISRKDVIIIQAKDELGKFHYGEISPLIGFSSESIDECECELHKIKSELLKLDLQEIKESILNLIKYPSLKFGIEQLLFSYDIKSKQVIIPINKVIKINALLGIKSFEESIEQIENFIHQGFDTIKIKIGKDNFDNELKIIREIQKLNNKIKIRLDNNAAWDFGVAENNLKKLEKFNIEFFEQPIEDLVELKLLSRNSKILIAPDESITNYEIGKKSIEEKIFKNIVLKPSIRIGIYDSIKLIKLANENGIKVIITSAFETTIGRNILILLAGLTNHNSAHGLNTELVGAEKIKPNINFQNPTITLSEQLIISKLHF